MLIIVADNNAFPQNLSPVSCMRRGCSRPADKILYVKYVEKKGLFCNSCADDLLASALVDSLDSSDDQSVLEGK